MKNLGQKVKLKLIEELASVKIHLILLATILLICGKLDGSSYATIVTGIGLGRVLLESVVAYRYKKDHISDQEAPQE